MLHAEDVCQDTLDAIHQVIKKIPKKKAAFKQFLTECMCETEEDLSEDQALEILEVMDSAAYVRVIKQKEKDEIANYHKLLIESVEAFLVENHEDYVVLDRVDDCYLVAKRINIIVQHKNENSIFQPFEAHNERQYFINVLIKTSDDFQPSPIIEKFMTRNCRMIKIFDMGAVERIMNGIT